MKSLVGTSNIIMYCVSHIYTLMHKQNVVKSGNGVVARDQESVLQHI